MSKEMDRSRFSRPGTKKPSQKLTKTPFGNAQPVPKVLLSVPRFAQQKVAREHLLVVKPVLGHIGQIVSGQTTHKEFIPINTRLAVKPQPAAAKLPKLAEPDQTAILARRQPMDMSLPGEESPSRLVALLQRTKWYRVRLYATRAVAVMLVLGITLGGLLVSQSYLKLHKVFRGTAGTAAALKPNVNPSLLKTEGDGRINILMLGRGGGTHEGPDLTDSMMLISIDPLNHTETLLSIPRDLWVSVPGSGAMKINSVWETGEFKYLGKVQPGSTNPAAINAGFKLVDQTVNQVLGVGVDYNVIVNFQAFQQAVDTIGGVTVNVPTALVDPTMAWENHNNPILAQAGTQTFNGQQALLYVRSRETTSDFARAQRQRAVVEAIKDKAISLGTLSDPLKISGLINAFGNNVATDLSLNDAVSLYNVVKNIGDAQTSSLDLDGATNPYVTTGNLNGQSIVLPIAGLFNYGNIQQYVRTQLKDPYILRENAKVLILNGTSMPGLATNMASTLQSYGYNVIGEADAPTTNWSQTTLYELNTKDKYTNNYLENRLHVTSQTKISNKTIDTDGADFVIIIGSNEANSNQN